MTDTTNNDAPAAENAGPSPMDGLKDAVKGLGQSALSYGLSRVGGPAGKITDRLTQFAEGKHGDDDGDGEGDEGGATGPVGQAVAGGVQAAASGDSPVGGALKGAFSGVKDKIKEKLPGGGGRKSAAKKFSNIVDSYDVGVPVRVAYNQWTQFNQWSEFMKKMEFAELNDDQGKVQFRGKVFVLHRSWESTIIDMVPDDHIVWQSTGEKGYLNGAVTFSELAHNLTRLTLVVEYHPAGFWENTINIWRSVGSRVRLETKLYIHHVMTSTQLDPDAAQGWRAEIHDKEIVRTHDEVVEQEQREQEEREERERQEQEDREREEQEGQDGDEFDDEASEDDEFADEDEAPQDDEFEDETSADDEFDDEDEAPQDDDEFDDEDEAPQDEDEDDRDGSADDDGPYDDEDSYDEDEDEEAYDEDGADDEQDEDRTPVGAGSGGSRGARQR